LLSFENGETKWYLPKESALAKGVHVIPVKLPDDVVCQQCVLQWRYRTGKILLLLQKSHVREIWLLLMNKHQKNLLKLKAGFRFIPRGNEKMCRIAHLSHLLGCC